MTDANPASLPRVVITDLMNDDLAPERGVLDGVADVVALDAHGEQDMVGHIEQAHALMVHHNVAITPSVIDRLACCRVIVRAGVGFDNVDHAYAAQRGIPVANVPDYGTEEVADAAMALALTLVRGVNMLNHNLQRGKGPWSYTQAAPLHRLRGRVFAMIGMGAIGMATARRAQAFGMHVRCFDPYLRAGLDKAMGVERVDNLKALLHDAYILSLHSALSPQTHHIVNRDTLALLPEGAYLINAARGALVDTGAIPDAIASGQLAGAGFDVVEGDPPSDDDPLITAWRDPQHPAHTRVVINPHVAFYSLQAMHEQRTKAALACKAALLGQAIPNQINSPVAR